MAEQTKTIRATSERSIWTNGGDHGDTSLYSAQAGKNGSLVTRELIRFGLGDDFDWTQVYRLVAAKLHTSGIQPAGNLIDFGSIPTMLIRTLSSGFPAGTKWSNQPGVTGPTVDTANAVLNATTPGVLPDDEAIVDVLKLVEYVAPASVLTHLGAACGGNANYGWRFAAKNESATSTNYVWFNKNDSVASLRPWLEITYELAAPAVPTVSIPAQGDPAIVAEGTELTVFYVFNGLAGDTNTKSELEVYTDAATDATAAAGNRVATTGAIAPSVQGSAPNYWIRITGLPRPHQDATWAIWRYRLRTQNQKGLWSPWTPLAEGRIKTAYKPGVPVSPLMQTNPEVPHILGTINSPDPNDYVTAWEGIFLRHNADGTTTPMWGQSGDTGKIEIAGSPRRSDVPWSGISLNDGDVVSWQHWQWNRDDIEGTHSPVYTTTMHTPTGPTITPPDRGTKLTSRTPTITITFGQSSDGYQWQLYRSDVKIHDSGVVTIAAAGSVNVTPPAGILNWGDGAKGELKITAASRPAGSGAQIGSTSAPWSPQSELYIDTLPATTLRASDGSGFTGPVIPTTDILWESPYIDPDVKVYSEVPVSKEVLIRVSAIPAGSGALILWRSNAVAGQIPENERTGRRLDPMTSAAGITATDANVTAATAATAPTGYSGNSLLVQANGSTSATRGATLLTTAGASDLSVFGSQTYFSLWRRCTNVTNLTRWFLRFTFATAGDYADFVLFANTEAINTWGLLTFLKSDPYATAGTVDWSKWNGTVRIVALPSGAYDGDMDTRDFVVGVTQSAKDAPDGNIVPETKVDARVRWRDNAAAKVTTTLAAGSAAGATNVKVASVAGLVVGESLTLAPAGEKTQESRTITDVGTAGSGGTGVTVSEGYTWAHANVEAAVVHSWGAWTPWVTVKASLPPAVAADTPADRALIADPTPALVHTFSSPGGKAQTLRTLRLYRRLGAALRALAGAPAAFWRLGETAGTAAVDQAAAHNGVYTAGYTLNQTGALSPADTDPGMLLNGTTGYVTVPTHADLHPGDTFSLLAWVKKAADGTAQTIIAAGTGDYCLRINASNQLELLKEGTGTPILTSVVTITGTGWHRVACVKAAATTKLYIDGALDPDATGANATIVASAVAIAIGRKASSSAEFFSGTLDEVSIYPRALSAAAIAADYLAQLEVPGDQLVYERNTAGTGLTDVGPTLLLSDATAYAWEITAYDSESLPGTTARRSFMTVFSVPAAVAGLTATTDADESSITLTWTASGDTYLDHYRVHWQDEHGDWLRIDGGPDAVDDGRTPLTDATFTWHGGRLGANAFRVTVHNGAQESDAANVIATLEPGRPGSWGIATDGDTRYTFPFNPDDAPRVGNPQIETFRPPGGDPVHLGWGTDWRHLSLRFQYIPIEDGNLRMAIREMLVGRIATWVKAPAPYQFDVMRVRFVGLADTPAPAGLVGLALECDEIPRP